MKLPKNKYIPKQIGMSNQFFLCASVPLRISKFSLRLSASAGLLFRLLGIFFFAFLSLRDS